MLKILIYFSITNIMLSLITIKFYFLRIIFIFENLFKLSFLIFFFFLF